MVKVLDFGLAKALAEERPESADPEMSPTLTLGPTVVGVILGTASYMSPEQAKGKNADRRSDIWSFGVLLYEMVTGQRLFTGEDMADVLAAVIHKTPDLSPLPARVRPAVERCLRREPRKRWYSMEDIRFALDEAPEPASVTEVPPQAKARASWIPWLVAMLGVSSAAALAWVHFREKPAEAPVQRYSIAPPENSTIHTFAVSPDGKFIVIAAAVNGKRQLYLRALDTLQTQPMAFTDGATYPFWSPDSRFIAFHADGKLRKVPVTGGPSQALCDAQTVRGGSWGPGDVIVFSPGNNFVSIQRVSAAGGVPTDIFKTKDDQRHPVFLPDGRHFLYVARNPGTERNGIYVASLDGAENRRVLADASGPLFAPSPTGGRIGRLLFIRENTLMAQPFDSQTAQLAGEVFPVADGVSPTANNTWMPASVSDHGILLYAAGGSASQFQFAWFDRSGKLLAPVGEPGPVQSPSLSPDEKTVAYDRANGAGGTDLWLRDLVRGTDTRFTSDASRNIVPVWSPKGDRIAYSSVRSGTAFDLYLKASNGTGQEEQIFGNGNTKAPVQWTRDGKYVVYEELDPKSGFDLWLFPIGEPPGPNRRATPFLRTQFSELLGQVSPDSHWIAYTSNLSGPYEIYVQPFPTGEGRWKVSVAGGRAPRWKGDGKELYFVAPDGKVMAVAVKSAIAGPNPSFEAGAPQSLFDSQITQGNNTHQYDVTADGKRFLITSRSSGSAAPPLTVVVNWFAQEKK